MFHFAFGPIYLDVAPLLQLSASSGPLCSFVPKSASLAAALYFALVGCWSLGMHLGNFFLHVLLLSWWFLSGWKRRKKREKTCDPDGLRYIVYVCMLACVYVCVYTHVSTHECVYTHVCLCHARMKQSVNLQVGCTCQSTCHKKIWAL